MILTGMRFLFPFVLAASSLSAQAPDAFTEACVSGNADERTIRALHSENKTERMKDCLEAAALNGHVGLVKILLKLGTPLDGFDGWTPLHVAAIYSYPDCIEAARLLLDAGANVNAITRVERNGIRAGLTPLGVTRAAREKFQAVFGINGYEKMSEFLKKRGGK